MKIVCFLFCFVFVFVFMVLENLLLAMALGLLGVRCELQFYIYLWCLIYFS